MISCHELVTSVNEKKKTKLTEKYDNGKLKILKKNCNKTTCTIKPNFDIDLTDKPSNKQ